MKIKYGLALGLTFAINSASGAVVTSTFDVDTEGWLVVGDSTSGIPIHVATGGNPDGHIQAADRVAGGVWYFQAPAKFYGDKSGAYNQLLTYDLKQTGSGSQFDAYDVLLKGAGIELRLGESETSNPLPVGSWVSYSISLNESGWFKGGVAATQADMMTVLASLDTLRIRGEYISGSDTGRLDNVSLTAVPVPAAAWLFASGLIGLSGLARRRS